MQKLTLSQFIAESGLNASLVRSTVRQMGGYASFVGMAQDVCNHGANAGFGGFIYYTDTVTFAKRNKKALLEMCKEQAEDYYGIESGVCEFIAGFNCVNLSREAIAIALYTGKGDCVTTIYNALAWYALEEVSRRYCDIVETFT